MWKRCTCFAFLIVLLALIQGGAAFGAFNALSDPALIGWWACDEGQGTTVADSSRNHYDGTAYSGLGGAAAVGTLTWAPGVYGNAVQLEYPNLIQIPAINMTLTDATMAGWMKPIGAQAAWTSFIMTRPTATGLNINPDAGNLQLCYHWGDASNTWGFRPNAYLADNEWNFAAVTIEPTQAVFYLNGTEVAVNAVAHVAVNWNSPIFLGGDGSGEQDPRRMTNGMLDDLSLFSRALTADEIVEIMGGLTDPNLASMPVPADGATDVPRDRDLGWKASASAASHDVYFGTSSADVDAATRANPMGVLVSQGQTGTTFDPGRMEFSQTYYWRVDEVAANGTIYKGDVWSFTVEPFVYAVPNVVATSNGASDAASGPEKTVDGSGLNAGDQHSVEADDMWVAYAPADGSALYIQYEFDGVYKLYELQVWNYNVMFEKMLGFGLKNVTVEYSTDGAEWTALGDFDLNQATAKGTYVYNSTIDFQGLAVKYVKLTVNSGFGMLGQYGLSEVRFMYLPVQAREPQPADGATDVEVGKVMSWRAGREAASHEVYLSTDPNALTLAGTADSASFAPALEFGSTYYWQVVEVNEAEAISTWAGDVWTFSTQEFALIDGFETYTDDVEAGEAIFDTWLDGWVNDNGSTVGYVEAPFAEKTVVHSGAQSMPLQYDNSASPFYSEAERVFEPAQNWTGNGADSLALYIRGNAPTFLEAADGSIIMNAIGTDIWNNADEFRYAYKSLSGNGSMVVRVDSIVPSDPWAKAGIMIRESLAPGSTHAFVCVPAGNSISFQRRPVVDAASASTDTTGLAAPYWVKLTRTGDVFTAQTSPDGATWTDITVSPALQIAMPTNVYIGLAVTSHNASVATAAEFSNLSTTGNVTGAWQIAEIGVAQPVGSSMEAMYVTIEDSAGKTKTVANADAAITARPTWQEWTIPYTDLNGVNLGRVQRIVIGVGNATSPAAGGTGTVYVDDIGFGRKAE